jgi:hypothetical protein
MVSIDTDVTSCQNNPMGKPNNHPAFPVTGYPGDKNMPAVRPNTGMGIRDWFAGLAMQGLLSNIKHFDNDNGIAVSAYLLADEMMLQREK